MVRGLGRAATRLGLLPPEGRFRFTRRVPVNTYLRWQREGVEVQTLHEANVAVNPLPENVTDRKVLSDDAGWWGYSMRDVPTRRSGPTRLITLHDATVLPFCDPERGYLRPAILTREEIALEMREVSFRPMHAEQLSAMPKPVEMEAATFVFERCYDNHSHWLTAHLPKFTLLRSLDRLDGLLMPETMTPVMEASLRRLGIQPNNYPTFEIGRPLRVGRLTLLQTDRFCPELLRPVRQAMVERRKDSTRRVFVSRDKAPRRQLRNEAEVWPMLADHGFEKVYLEDLSFGEQVELMRETAVLFAPHGAGLTNMMFCPEGASIVEIADLTFPNPNFYALAAAMGHRYWLLPGRGVGDGPSLERDLTIDPAEVAAFLQQLDPKAAAG